MPYRELLVVEVREVLRLWASGLGFKTVARRTGMDRKTIKRYVAAAQGQGLAREGGRLVDDDLVAEVVSLVRPGGSREPGSTRRLCQLHQERIEGWLDDGCRGPKIVKLLKRHTGISVPLRTLQRFITEEIDRGRRGDTVRIADGDPGVVLEMDFMELGYFEELESGRRRKMHALICVAHFSRHQFVWPCLGQTRDDVIEGLEAAWAFFGGIFGVVVTDNMSAVVDQADPLKPRLNALFLEYAQARGFQLDITRVRKPRDKARVERQVRFARDDFFAGERFGSVLEAREAAARWCREDAGLRVHGRTRQRPLEVFESEERPRLTAPPDAPYDAPLWADARVGRDHVICVEHALYSVPFHVVNEDLRVRLDRTTIKIYRGAQLIKLHPRQPPGGSHIDAADLPPGKAELATQSGESVRQVAVLHGPNVGRYVDGLLEGPLPWTRMRHVFRLLGLARRYGGPLVDAACAQALALDVVDVTRIDRMLERNLVSRPPRRPPKPTSNIVPLRFARQPSEWKPQPEGEPDAPA